MTAPRRTLFRLFAAAIFCSLLVGMTLIPAPPAHAKSVSVGARFGDPGSVNAYGKSAGKSKGKKKKHRKAPTGPRLQYLSVLDCEPNSPAGAPTTTCAQATEGCASGQVRVRVFEAPLGTAFTGTWKATASRCVNSADAHLGEVVVPQLTGSILRNFPIPAGAAGVEPDNGYGLIHMQTNIYAKNTEPTTIRTTVLGLEMVIRATPVAFAWDYGDGSTFGPTDDPGGPYPTLTTAHVYQRTGSYNIVLRTTYQAEFSVNGGAYQPVTGTTEVVSAPVQITILSGTARLRDEAAPTTGP